MLPVVKKAFLMEKEMKKSEIINFEKYFSQQGKVK